MRRVGRSCFLGEQQRSDGLSRRQAAAWSQIRRASTPQRGPTRMALGVWRSGGLCHLRAHASPRPSGFWNVLSGRKVGRALRMKGWGWGGGWRGEGRGRHSGVATPANVSLLLLTDRRRRASRQQPQRGEDFFFLCVCVWFFAQHLRQPSLLCFSVPGYLLFAKLESFIGPVTHFGWQTLWVCKGGGLGRRRGGGVIVGGVTPRVTPSIQTTPECDPGEIKHTQKDKTALLFCPAIRTQKRWTQQHL